MDDEKALLSRARALDEEALSILFDRYYEPLYRYIYHHVGHVQVAEDLAARVFHRLLEQLHAGRGPDRHLKAWLYRVARNLVIDESRRRKHRDHMRLDERLTDEEQDVPEQAQANILHRQARAALEKLTPRQRDVIILKYLEQYENEEIARLLGLSVGAVKALQHRGLAALRRHLHRMGAVEKEVKR